jgi:hypothetical protein
MATVPNFEVISDEFNIDFSGTYISRIIIFPRHQELTVIIMTNIFRLYENIFSDTQSHDSFVEILNAQKFI